MAMFARAQRAQHRTRTPHRERLSGVKRVRGAQREERQHEQAVGASETIHAKRAARGGGEEGATAGAVLGNQGARTMGAVARFPRIPRCDSMPSCGGALLREAS